MNNNKTMLRNCKIFEKNMDECVGNVEQNENDDNENVDIDENVVL